MKGYDEDLYRHLQSMPFYDYYATPKVKNGVLTNITELLKTSEKNRMLSLYFCDKKRNIEELSDFEYYEAACTMLTRWIGTREGAVSEEELFILYGEEFDIELLQSEDFLRDQWQIANRRLRNIGGKYGEFLSKNGVEKLYERQEPFLSFNRVEKYNDERDTLSLLCDFRSLDFQRPNAYSVSCAEQKHARGELLSSEEASLLAAQALYRCCTADRTKAIELRLRADGDGRTASDMIAYLKRLGMRGCVWLVDDGSMSVGTILALCEQSDSNLSVRPELVLGENDARPYAYTRLQILSARYPMDRWHFGGVPGDAPIFFAGHVHMRRILAHLICEIAAGERDRIRLFEQIFGPSNR